MSAANGTNDTARCAHPRGYNAAGSCFVCDAKIGPSISEIGDRSGKSSRSSATLRRAVPAAAAHDDDQLEESAEPVRRVGADELLLAQLAQTVIATRTQAAATIEQCDSALMVVHALQQRERDRQESLRSFIAPAPKPTMPPMFGRKQEG
jgi:hypothetical protein